MITLSDNANGARQAALLMHTLGDADRRWMLSQLGPAARTEAEQLLAELATLGVPADPVLLHAVLTRPPGHGNGARSGTAASASAASAADSDLPLDRLARATVPEMVALLQNEPDALIACLLKEARQADWSWRTGLLDRLGPARRRRIGELLAEDAASSASASSPAAMSVRGARVAELVAARLARPSVDDRAAASRGSHASRSWGARLAQRLSPWSRR